MSGVIFFQVRLQSIPPDSEVSSVASAPSELLKGERVCSECRQNHIRRWKATSAQYYLSYVRNNTINVVLIEFYIRSG